MRTRAVALGVAHAIVDAGCAFVLLRFLAADGRSPESVAAWIVAYDSLAFAGQVPLALAADRLRALRAAALAGVALVIAALVVAPLAAGTAALLAGVGNALFHVGAGGHVLGQSRGRAAEAGLFVGPGAVGLALGILAGRGAAVTVWPFAAALALALAIVVFSWSRNPLSEFGREPAAGAASVEVGAENAGLRSPTMPSWSIASLLLLVVALRSLVGDSVASPWRSEVAAALTLAAAAAAGKMLGGVVADRLGWLAASLSALAVATLLLAAGSGPPVQASAVAAVIACSVMLLVQTTTGVTLAALAVLLPGRPALAFAFASTAVLAGVVPGWLAAGPETGSLWLPAACGFSALVLATVLDRRRAAAAEAAAGEARMRRG